MTVTSRFGRALMLLCVTASFLSQPSSQPLWAQEAKPKSRFAKLDAIRVHYNDYGKVRVF